MAKMIDREERFTVIKQAAAFYDDSDLQAARKVLEEWGDDRGLCLVEFSGIVEQEDFESGITHKKIIARFYNPKEHEE